MWRSVCGCIFQGNAATNNRWSGKFNHTFVGRQVLFAAMKELLKSDSIVKVMLKWKKVQFFSDSQCIYFHKCLHLWLRYVVAPVIKAQALTEAIQIAGYAIGSTVFLIYIIFFVGVVIHYGCQEVNRRRNRYDIISLLLVNSVIIQRYLWYVTNGKGHKIFFDFYSSMFLHNILNHTVYCRTAFVVYGCEGTP